MQTSPQAENRPVSRIENFDSAPDCQLVDIDTLRQLTGKCRATLYRWIKAGALPKPRRFGKTRNMWTAGEIRRALGLSKGAAA